MVKYRDFVYDIVRKIPRGKVGTYGRVAAMVNIQFPRKKITPQMVGWALHANPDPKGIPCHRVVNKVGKIADCFAFGGWKEQKRRLEMEGVTFKDERLVDLVVQYFGSLF